MSTQFILDTRVQKDVTGCQIRTAWEWPIKSIFECSKNRLFHEICETRIVLMKDDPMALVSFLISLKFLSKHCTINKQPYCFLKYFVRDELSLNLVSVKTAMDCLKTALNSQLLFYFPAHKHRLLR